MKRYRVTKKHPELKPGNTIEEYHENGCQEYALNGGIAIEINPNIIPYYLTEGFIEEIQESEYTRQDMLDLLEFADSDYVQRSGLLDWDAIIEEWIKSKNT